MSIRESLVPVERLKLPDAGVRRLDVSAEQAASLAALTIDAILIVLVSLGSGVAYQEIAFGVHGDLTVLAGTGAIVAACFCAFTRIVEVADPLRVSSGVGRARSAITAWVSTFLFLMLLAFALKIGATFSRGAIFSFFVVGLGVVVASRVLVPRVLVRWRRTFAFRGVEAIVVGAGEDIDASPLVTELRHGGCARIHLINLNGTCDAGDWSGERQRVIDQILAIARAAAPGAIFVDGAALQGERLASIVSGLRIVPRAVQVIPDSSVAALLRYSVRTVGTSVALEMQREPLNFTQRAVKRAIDVALSLLALVLLSPLFLLLCLLIRLDSRGPVVFRQTRNGLGGRPFRIFKFRTMSVMEDGAEVCQAVRKDGRVTRVGRFLRRTSLDEVPQLLNVLMGEMSLVGPRPHARAHDEHYATLVENYQVRQHVKPGLTGWAQVSGYRGETPTVELMRHRLECDLWYAANASLSLDFLILLRTLPVLLGGRNAY